MWKLSEYPEHSMRVEKKCTQNNKYRHYMNILCVHIILYIIFPFGQKIINCRRTSILVQITIISKLTQIGQFSKRWSSSSGDRVKMTI